MNAASKGKFISKLREWEWRIICKLIREYVLTEWIKAASMLTLSKATILIGAQDVCIEMKVN